jgi:hypothetical protein
MKIQVASVVMMMVSVSADTSHFSGLRGSLTSTVDIHHRELPKDSQGNQEPAEESGWTCEPINLTAIYGDNYCTIHEDTLDGQFKSSCCGQKNLNKHDEVYMDEANWGYDCCKCINTQTGNFRYGPVNEDGVKNDFVNDFDERCGGIAFGTSP